jgi:hypothetical protein
MQQSQLALALPTAYLSQDSNSNNSSSCKKMNSRTQPLTDSAVVELVHCCSTVTVIAALALLLLVERVHVRMGYPTVCIAGMPTCELPPPPLIYMHSAETTVLCLLLRVCFQCARYVQ